MSSDEECQDGFITHQPSWQSEKFKTYKRKLDSNDKVSFCRFGASLMASQPIVLFVNSLLLLTEQVSMNLESNFLLYVLNFSDCQDGWCVMNPSWHSSSEDMYLFSNAALILVFFTLLNSIFSRAVTLRYHLGRWKNSRHTKEN
jgi:hypothetical protein